MIGDEGQPTTVMLLDLFDNGNRTGGEAEALYLYGMGGLDGLEMYPGSRLVFDGIDVYARQKNALDQYEWVHLNDLFTPGTKEVAFAGGTIAVPEPSTLALLASALLAWAILRRRVS